jgi:hypothetical protein
MTDAWRKLLVGHGWDEETNPFDFVRELAETARDRAGECMELSRELSGVRLDRDALRKELGRAEARASSCQ